jgi:hypothetical protein
VAPATAWVVPAALAVVRRPGLWWTAVHQLRALAAPGWWRRPPHLPLPAPAYLRFRFITAYGDPDAAPTPADVVGYLRWCGDERRRRSARGHLNAVPAGGGGR